MSVHSLINAKGTKKQTLTTSYSVKNLNESLNKDAPIQNNKALTYNPGPKGTKFRSSYISPFDENFKVDLNIEESPSVSKMSVRSIDLSKKAKKITNLVAAFLCMSSAFLLISVNLLVDFGFLETKSHLLIRYITELPFIIVCFVVNLNFFMVGLKYFKHN